MKLHADLDQAAIVDGTALPWVPSPLPGVERRMLERDGDELARATSIVRYAAKSRFKAHTHGGGEEFLVLDGVFSDEHGNFPAGTYVRNPVGTRHEPYTEHGCILLVKLWWMHSADQAAVVIDTRAGQSWAPLIPGVERRPLHRFDAEETALLRFAPGAVLPKHPIFSGEEFFVVEGALQDAERSYGRYGWVRRPAGAAPKLVALVPSILYLKRGHLAKVPPRPVP